LTTGETTRSLQEDEEWQQACTEACGGSEWTWRGNPRPEDHQGHTRLICLALYIPARARRQGAGGWQQWERATAKELERLLGRELNFEEGLLWVDFCPFQPKFNTDVDQALLLAYVGEAEGGEAEPGFESAAA
jgi:hypothetical protein